MHFLLYCTLYHVRTCNYLLTPIIQRVLCIYNTQYLMNKWFSLLAYFLNHLVNEIPAVQLILSHYSIKQRFDTTSLQNVIKSTYKNVF